MDVSSPIALTGSDQAARATACIFQGWTIRETAGAAAYVRMYDNASAASGTLVGEVSLAANGSSTIVGAGIRCTAGLYVDIVSGTVEGSVFIG